MSDPVAVVTGASRGIGAAVARRFAADGIAVALAARSADPLRELCDEIRGAGGRAVAITTDVGDPDALEALVDATVDEFGRLDILVNNAGVLPAARRSERTSLESWNDTLATNLTGPWWLANRAHDAMVASGDGGVIVNVTSTAATFPSVGLAGYNASKAALTMITRTLALEWARDGVRVVAVAPGKTDTAMVEPIVAWAESRNLPLNPLGRLGSPDEVAATIAFLASPAAAYITGSVVTVDGGELLEH